MGIKKSKVTIVARLGADIHLLSRLDGPLAIPCGAVGPSIARAVLAGGGQAEVPMSKLRIAIDTQEGVEAILDSFELYESKTKAPLILYLIDVHLKD